MIFSHVAGSDQEREVFAKAELHKNDLTEEEKGVSIKIKVSEGMNNGCDFDVYAVISNSTATERLCRLIFCARTVSYKGVVGPECGMKDLLNVTLLPHAGKRLPPGMKEGDTGTKAGRR